MHKKNVILYITNKMQFILLVFGIILPLVVSHKVLTAKKHGADAVLFILFPEEDVPAEAYKSLGKYD